MTFYPKYKEKPFKGDRGVARSVKKAVCYVAFGKGQKWRVPVRSGERKEKGVIDRS